MYQLQKTVPTRVLVALALFTLLLVGVARSLLVGGSGSDNDIPELSKPSIFYSLNKAISTPEARVQKLNRQMWQGSYEMDAINADPEQSAWFSGRYQVPGPGVDPNAVGKLSDQELKLFRNELRGRFDDDWRYAPSDIRGEYEQMYRNQGISR